MRSHDEDHDSDAAIRETVVSLPPLKNTTNAKGEEKRELNCHSHVESSVFERPKAD